METRGLKAELGLIQLTTLGFGSIVGVAWVVLLGDLIAKAGSLGTLIGFFIAAMMMTLIGMCYVEMATRFPSAGGEVVYVENTYGARAATLVGWFLLFAFVLVCCFEMISVGWVFGVLFPDFTGIELYSVFGTRVYSVPLIVSLFIQFIIFAVNWLGPRSTGRLQNFMTLGKLALSAAFIVAGLSVANPRYVEPLFVLDASGSAWSGTLAVISIAPFWFSGFNVISQAMGEKSNLLSPRTAGFSIVISLLSAWVFYSLVLVATVLIMPRDQLLSNELPTAAAFAAAFHSVGWGKVVLFAGLMGLVSTWNAVFYAATRILYVLGQSGSVAHCFGKLHPSRCTPTNAILLLAVLIPLGASLGRGVVGTLLNTFSIVMAIIYAAICAAVLVLRKRDAMDRPSAATNVSKAVIPFFGVMAAVSIVVIGLTDLSHEIERGRFPIGLGMLAFWTVCGVLISKRRVSRSKTSPA